MLVGLSLGVHAIVMVYANPDEIRNVQTLVEVSLPVVMVLGFSPYVYILLILSHYEQIFIRIELGIEKPSGFKRRAKWEIIKSLRLSHKKLNAFLGPASSALMRTNSLNEVREILTNANRE